MAVSPILGIPLTAPTQLNKTQTMSDGIVQLEAAREDQLVVDMSGGSVTLTPTQYTRAGTFVCKEMLTDVNLVVPLTKRIIAIRNDGTQTVTVKGLTGASVDVLAGDGAIIQNDGTNCSVLGSGGPGPSGSAGADGADGLPGPPGGGISIQYAFNTSTTNADHGDGTIALDNAVPSIATALYVDLLDAFGFDWTDVLDTLADSTSTSKGEIRLFDLDSPGHFMIASVTAVTTHSGYREITIVPYAVSTVVAFDAAADVAISFSRTGDVGGISVADGDMIANIAGSLAAPSGVTFSNFLDAVIASTQGEIVVRDGASWVGLPPGTVGKVLTSGGAGADLAWQTPEWTAGTITALGANLTNIGGTLVATDTDTNIWNAGTVTDLGANLSLTTGTLTVTIPAAEWSAGTITALGANLTNTSGTLVATDTNTNIWNAGTVTALGPGISAAAGTLTATGNAQQWTGGTVTAVGSGLGITAGTIAATGTAAPQQWTAGTITAIGANLTNSGGTLVATDTNTNIWNNGTVTASGNGIAINSGTISADTQGTITATATGTISPTGLQSAIVNMGTVNTTLTCSPGYQGQHLRLEIKQGATAHTVALDSTFAFGLDITSFTATPTANARDLMQLICVDGTHWAVAAVNHGFSV